VPFILAKRTLSIISRSVAEWITVLTLLQYVSIRIDQILARTRGKHLEKGWRGPEKAVGTPPPVVSWRILILEGWVPSEPLAIITRDTAKVS
jgi:hypothetical protein